jgi:AcrR family transcriptional regulator
MPKVVPEYKEQAVKRILDAADHEFSNKGYKNTTITDIAEKVGVSKAAVYQYFKSRDDLIAALADSQVDGIVWNEISRDRDETVIEKTSGAFERILDSVPSWFPQMICDFLSEAFHDKNARKRVRDFDQKLVLAISALWEEGKKDGEVPQDFDTESVARALVALCLGLMAFVSTGLPRSEAAKAWRELVHRIGRGLS